MRALFGESERDSPFVRSVRRVGGVNGKFSGNCQSILVMSNLFFARTTKFLQQIADVFWRYLTILKAAKTYAWSWLHLLMLGCISSMPPIIWKGMGHSFSPARAAFSCYPGCSGRKLPKYHSWCSGNCWWQYAVLCNQLMAQAKACIQPGFQFYHQKFSVQFHGTVRAFKAARLCCPVQVQALNPTAASLEELRNFPFANDDATIANLAQELPLYLAASDGVTVTCEDDKLTWWANHKDTLPHWSSLVKKLLLIQPSSASAERVFSLLTNAFGSRQESALQDYLKASVMLRYNNAKRL